MFYACKSTGPIEEQNIVQTFDCNNFVVSQSSMQVLNDRHLRSRLNPKYMKLDLKALQDRLMFN